MSRSNPEPYKEKPKATLPRTPRPEPGLKVHSTDLPATIARLEGEGRKVLGMTRKREGTAVNYYLNLL